MSTLKKSLIRVKSTLNKKLVHQEHSPSATGTPTSTSSASTTPDMTPPATLQPAQLEESRDYFSLKYEDIAKRDLQNRKRNFSQTNSVASSSSVTRKSSNEFSDGISRSHSVSSSLHDIQETTDTTVLLQQISGGAAMANESLVDPLESIGNIRDQGIDQDVLEPELLPPRPFEGQPPCNTEELSPVFPQSISPLAEQFPNMGAERQNSCSSIASTSTAAPARLSNLRSSIASQTSIPALSNSSSITPIQELPVPLENKLPLNAMGVLEQRHVVSNNEDDLADAMAISILEKVPHHEGNSVNVEDWCI